MPSFNFSRRPFSRPPLRDRRRHTGPRVAAVELLEERTLLSSVVVGSLTDQPPARPTLIGPSAATTDETPTISWQAVAGATTYDLWVNHLTTDTSEVIRQTALSTTEFTPSTPLAGGRYRMWVRAINDGGPGLWSKPVEFDIFVAGQPPAQAVLSTPLGTTTDTTPTFTWLPIAGAMRYDLWVNNRTTGQQQVIRQTDLTSTSFTPSAVLPAGNYRAWLQAANDFGAGAWSRALDFTVSTLQPPVLAAPSGIIDEARPEFTWTADASAVQFDLWVDNRTTNKFQYLRENTITTAEYVAAVPFDDGMYRVWVRAFDANGIGSPWSSALDFTIDTAIDAPTWITPTANPNTTTPGFSWSAVQDVAHYDLWVTHRTSGHIIIREQQLTSTTFVPTDELPNGEYRAWVRAIGANDVVGDWSSAQTFSITTNAAGRVAIVDAWLDERIDTDADGYATQVRINWDATISAGSRVVLARIYRDNVLFGETALGTPQSFTVVSTRTQTHSLTLNISTDTELELGKHDLRVRIFDALTNAELAARTESDTDLNDVRLEPGGDGTQLANGEWTIISHGLSTFDYSDLIEPVDFVSGAANFMWGLAEKLRAESGNIAIHTMNATATSLAAIINPGVSGDISDIVFDDTGFHHVLLFDWAEVSNYADSILGDISELPVTRPPVGASGTNGYAEASGDFLYSLLVGAGIADNVHATIGYSRGGVVTSEAVQRLLIDGDDDTQVTQVIFLDAEGGQPVYTDKDFRAWVGTRTDNYYQRFSATSGGLGGNTVNGARNYNADSLFGGLYSHSNLPEYFIGHPDDDRSGLFILDGLIVTQDTPAAVNGAPADPETVAPPADEELFNGDWEFTDSTAGWYYHGGGVASTGFGKVVEGHLLLAGGESRTHNWSVVPAATVTLEFDLEVIHWEPGTEVVVEWSGTDGEFTEIGRADLRDADALADMTQPLVAANLGGQSLHAALPTDDRVGRVRLSVVGLETASVAFDNLHFSTAAVVRPGVPSLTSPTSTILGNEVTFEWTEVDGATGYDLWLNNQTTGQSQFVRQQHITGTSYTLPVDLPVGEYRVWVRAVGNDFAIGEWSRLQRFVVAEDPEALSIVFADSANLFETLNRLQ